LVGIDREIIGIYRALYGSQGFIGIWHLFAIYMDMMIMMGISFVGISWGYNGNIMGIYW
jgi:hypothetical protein